MKASSGIAILGAALLAGCQAQLNVLEAHGNLRVEKSTLQGSDYAVYIKNVVDFGLNPDDRETRFKIATDYMKAQCPAGTVVSSDEITTGRYLTGRAAKTYIVYIRCR
ncbi:hypothetical protein [Rhizobium paknamense]|uniref:Lipoprotein n=1 Tax=Rhizobium paknamense TaxID=1206817 RepID=A0ABU0IBP8_9HYPH|nr:hypothetical protein [Rhizobium paknamense]MDQ0454674.1 hypothetical protein [Rhizobium paknamense]